MNDILIQIHEMTQIINPELVLVCIMISALIWAAGSLHAEVKNG